MSGDGSHHVTAGPSPQSEEEAGGRDGTEKLWRVRENMCDGPREGAADDGQWSAPELIESGVKRAAKSHLFTDRDDHRSEGQ